MTEQELIAGCIKEDRKCQQALFRRYSGILLAVCMRYARHQMEAEDIVQDAFIKIFDNLTQFHNKGSFEGWMKRIVINTALKKANRKSFKNEQIGIEDHVDQPFNPSVYDDLEVDEIMAMIHQLPDGYRIVFNLYAIEGYSHKEIADLLGIQESTSRSQLVKARKMLQQLVLKTQKVIV